MTYDFNNIRYADPPVGKNRFKAPIAVSTVNRTVNDGNVKHMCPQAYPEWALAPVAQASNITADNLLKALLSDPAISEDCLFLDVIVPQGIFDTNDPPCQQDSHCVQSHSCKWATAPSSWIEILTETAPVVIWVYGGGYDFGKNSLLSFPMYSLHSADTDIVTR